MDEASKLVHSKNKPCTVMDLETGAPLLMLVVENMYTPGNLSVRVSVYLTVAVVALTTVRMRPSPPVITVSLGRVQKAVVGGPPVVVLVRVNSSGSSLISENWGATDIDTTPVE